MDANIEFRNLILEVEYSYQPTEPTVMYYKDGTGDPGCPSSVEISDVKHCGESIMDLLHKDTLKELEEETLTEHENE